MRALLLATLCLAGCYDPEPPSGAYLCGADDACPGELVCDCGQCVTAVGDGACSFRVTSSRGAREFSVKEHERFPVTIEALNQAGGVATRFGGKVRLSSSWGDVCVGTSGCAGLPDQVTLSGGTATVDVQLNRETVGPASAVLIADFAGVRGTSGSLDITVTAPDFVRDASPIVAPLETTFAGGVTPVTTFGYAALVAGAPSVVKVQDGWRMYFLGAAQVMGTQKLTVGVARSSDGRAFTPPSAPLFPLEQTGSDIGGYVSALVTGDGVELYGGLGQAHPFRGVVDMSDERYDAVLGYERLIARISASVDGPFNAREPAVTFAGSAPSLIRCDYCDALDAPTVVFDANAAFYGGSSKTKLMYFSSIETGMTQNGGVSFQVSVSRAAALDGEAFEVDRSPVLTATPDELVIYAPHVLLDGTVYKMYYSTIGLDFFSGANALLLPRVYDPCSVDYHVGYATSTDGRFWVRSPRNKPGEVRGTTVKPVLDVAPAGTWEKDGSVLVGSVVPQDGVDPANGIAIYYSPFMRVGPPLQPAQQVCVVNGIGRAVQ
jgi:hypothetical protein